jgi:glycosyltransferase involved in cell wall biosynthesis/GT2 family glycosyltransferase
MLPTFPPASVIINTYNRGPFLNDAIAALRGLDYPDFEVIVVNGPSTDNSADTIAGWGSAIKALTCDEANLSASRNIGITAAAGDFICFMDDDATPHPQWLKRLAVAYRDPEVGGVGGFTIDNTGVRWQVRKTICDRYGNAHNVTAYFDERPLNRPGSPYYPSLLGTNSSFRATALKRIGGFDSTFAYLLDETDVCLRLVDAGWKIVYEPSALIYHQFAESHIRSNDRIARTLFPSAVSKTYFVMRHGGRASAAKAVAELERYRTEISDANRWLAEHGRISERHRFSLDEDLHQGIATGQRLAGSRGNKVSGDLAQEPPPPFNAFACGQGRRIALVSQGLPPHNESGIARWTAMVADGLVARGHHVHVLTRAIGDHETVSFRNGMWVHSLLADNENAAINAEAYAIPHSLAAWGMRVWREVQYLKSFGLEIASFPIWDLEGLPLLDDPDIQTIVSLHTTYAMALPFKPEWHERPLYRHHFVDKVIAAEKAVFARAPLLLANSQAIIDAIEARYDVSIAARAPIVPHGTPDPLLTRANAAKARDAALLAGDRLRVLYVGRFEQRKGFDIAIDVAHRLMDAPDIEMRFIGDALDDQHRDAIRLAGAGDILASDRVAFLGTVTREALDDAYVAADLVLMPSRFESFGLVAIEAMAAGRPVLALQSGGLAEVATVANGCRSWPDGPDVGASIAAEIRALNADRKVLRQRGEAARQAFEMHYSVAAMAAGIEQVYDRLIALAGPDSAVRGEEQLADVD